MLSKIIASSNCNHQVITSISLDYSVQTSYLLLLTKYSILLPIFVSSSNMKFHLLQTIRGQDTFDILLHLIKT